MWYVRFRRIVLVFLATFSACILGIMLTIWNTPPAKASVQQEAICFPFLIPETDLIAEYFVSYEGDYFEDGSGEFVMDCAALCIYNKEDRYIEFASVEVQTQDGSYCFEGTCIPPRGKIIILEKNRKSYPSGNVLNAKGRTVYAVEANILDSLTIDYISTGCLEVTNQSEKTINNAVLYYKRYDKQWGIYIGGVTYAVSVLDLQPGDSKPIYLSIFAWGYSRFLFATK